MRPMVAPETVFMTVGPLHCACAARPKNLRFKYQSETTHKKEKQSLLSLTKSETTKTCV